ncbi:right-handed parallel beta-helix repeat-containing protein [Bacteroidota bacterium]
MSKTIKAIIFQLIIFTSVSATTYYVSPTGDNNNKGTSESKPFLVVQFAIDKMKAGDTLIVLDGFYTGTLQLKSGITIQAKNPRKVVFSGAEQLKGTNFTQHSDNIYKSKISTPPKQLFYMGKPMPWASWPKVTHANNWVKSKRWVEGEQVGEERIIKADFSSIKDLDLSGGVCYLRDLTSVQRHNIESFDGTNLKIETIGNRRKTNSSMFLLAGAVDLVSAPGEWAYKDGTLYFYPPDGKKPNATELYAQTNDYTINEIQALSDIIIEGVDFFATSVKLQEAGNKNIIFRNVYFTYTGGEIDYDGNKLNPLENRPVQISGTEILFDRCLFAGARLTALAFTDAPDFTVQNCVFMENNPYGSFGARAMSVRANGPFTITRNTFFNVNSDAVSVSFRGFQGDGNPHISYNNIFNAGVFNPDVSGVYLPNKNMYWTEFHHNWAHNCNGNAVRLDQAGQHFSVHHNVCWASRRGLNIEGFDSFSIYNNTSVHNLTSCFITRNVDDKRKGNGDATPSHDFSFPPIDDWNVLNNLITRFVDRVGPSERSQYGRASIEGILHPDRPEKWDGTIPVTERGDVKGNLTGFSQDIFANGSLDGLNLIPIDDVVRNGAVQTAELAAEGIDDLDSFRGAYDVGETNPWVPGSDWMPYGLPVLKTMAESEAFAKKVRPGSILPEINITDLPKGSLD